MASPLSLALRAITPLDREHHCVEGECAHQPVTAKPTKTAVRAKHTRRGPYVDRSGHLLLWHTTKRKPWVLRAEQHARTKRQRAARKANR